MEKRQLKHSKDKIPFARPYKNSPSNPPTLFSKRMSVEKKSSSKKMSNPSSASASYTNLHIQSPLSLGTSSPK